MQETKEAGKTQSNGGGAEKGANQPTPPQNTICQANSSAEEDKRVNKVSESGSSGEQSPARRLTRSMRASRHHTLDQAAHTNSSNSDTSPPDVTPTTQPREATRKRKTAAVTQISPPVKENKRRVSGTTPFAGLDSYPVMLLTKLKSKINGAVGTLQALHKTVIEGIIDSCFALRTRVHW